MLQNGYESSDLAPPSSPSGLLALFRVVKHNLSQKRCILCSMTTCVPLRHIGRQDSRRVKNFYENLPGSRPPRLVRGVYFAKHGNTQPKPPKRWPSRRAATQGDERNAATVSRCVRTIQRVQQQTVPDQEPAVAETIARSTLPKFSQSSEKYSS